MWKKFLVSAAMGMTCLLVLGACDGAKKTSNQVQVVTTTGMIADLVENIGKEFVDVTSLMGPGVDPHLYRASEGDVRRLSNADIIFYNGLHLEAKMGEVLEKMGATQTVVAVTNRIKSIELLQSEAYPELNDPHVWFDVRLWSLTIDVVRDTLIEKDPKNKDFYTKNAAALHQTFRKLDADIRKDLETIPEENRVLVTAHDAFAYFGQAYDLDVRGLQGMNTQAEAGARDVQDLARFIVTEKVPAIFVETSISDKHLVAVQKAVESRGGSVVIGGSLYSDAMGLPGTEEGTYQGMVRHNVKQIVNALAK